MFISTYLFIYGFWKSIHRHINDNILVYYIMFAQSSIKYNKLLHLLFLNSCAVIKYYQ